ncbi:MAG: phage major capsid protein [Nitrospirota bacterium]|nr:phage major capsid protein [Nitrospirota bacterium]
MSFEKIKALREQRAKLVADAQAILKHEKMSKEDEAKFDTMMADSDAIKAELDRHERASSAEQDLSRRIEQRAGREHVSPDQAEDDTKKNNAAYLNYVRFGIAGLSDDDRARMSARYVGDPRMGGGLNIRAAQGVGTGAGGGYSVPDEAMRPIVEAMKAFGGMRAVSTVVPTTSGADLPIPTDNDTAVAGEIINENTVHNDGDITFGQVVLQSFLYSSKIVKVSRQLLQDSSVDLNVYIGRKLGQRIGRIQNTHFTTGDGSAKPRGVVTASTLGKTAAGAAAITYDEMVDLLHSVDPSYQDGGRYMLNFTTLGLVRKLKDSSNMPVWAPMANGMPDTILGRPYIINQDMPAATTGLKSVLFGDFSNYHIRDAGNVILLRLEERYADALQVGFLAFLRSDGDLVDAGTNPVKHLIQA